MWPNAEPFLRAEAEYRRERIRADFAASARRREARRARRRPAARHAATQVQGRLVTGN